MLWSKGRSMFVFVGQEEGGEQGMRGICMEVAGLLEEVAAAGDEIEDEPPEAAPAAQRFAQGVQASLAAAQATGHLPDSHRFALFHFLLYSLVLHI